MKLLNTNVLLKEVIEESISPSGIILNSPQNTFKKGEIIEVGEGRYNEAINSFLEMAPKKGNHVLYKYGQDVTIEGQPYVLVEENNIIAILD